MLMMIIIHTFMNLSDCLLHALPTEALFLLSNIINKTIFLILFLNQLIFMLYSTIYILCLYS